MERGFSHQTLGSQIKYKKTFKALFSVSVYVLPRRVFHTQLIKMYCLEEDTQMLEMSVKLLNLNSISLCSSCCCMHWDCRTKISNAYYWIFHAFNSVSFVLSVLGRWILKCRCLYFCMFLIGYHYSIIRYPFYLVNTNVIESIYLKLVSPHHRSFGIFFSGHVFSIVSF